MINLLPSSEKKQIRAARANTLLFRYTILSIVAVAFIAGAMAFVYVQLENEGTRADATKQANESKAAGFAQTQQEATQLRNDLSNAKKVFDSEIRYSKALVNFSALIPSGAYISTIQLDADSFDKPKTWLFNIKGEQAASNLRDNFLKSPYFTNVTLGKVMTSSSSDYPYTIEVTATMKKSIAQ